MIYTIILQKETILGLNEEEWIDNNVLRKKIILWRKDVFLLLKLDLFWENVKASCLKKSDSWNLFNTGKTNNKQIYTLDWELSWA